MESRPEERSDVRHGERSLPENSRKAERRRKKEKGKRKKEKGKRIKDKGEQAQVSFNVYPLYPLSFYIRNRNYNFLII